MRPRRALLRARADRDARDAVDFYLAENAPDTALRFVDALEQALREIENNPAIGSPLYAHELNLPGLCAWPLKGFPHLVFYMEAGGHLDVWRVLHGRRDIPEWLHAPG